MCEPDERADIMAAVEDDPLGAATVETDDSGNYVTLIIAGRRLVTAHRLSLTKPQADPTLN
jgi:hypothetical protein